MLKFGVVICSREWVGRNWLVIIRDLLVVMNYFVQ